jgi:NDP-hexose-3-ketoreductase
MGLASIAQRSVIPVILKRPDLFELKAIGRRSVKDAKSTPSYQGAKIFGSYEELLQMPELDAIYIPLPTGLHFEWIAKVLNQGLHVLVEKSLATNLSEVEHLTEAAAQKQLVLMETFQFRFHPQMLALKNLVESGQLGPIRSISSCFSFPPLKNKQNIRYQKALGGGALLDAGAYTLKISQMLSPKALRVLSASSVIDSQKGVDLWGSAHLVSSDETVSAHITYGFDHSYRCFVEVLGSKGRASAERIFTAPASLQAVVKEIQEHGTVINHTFDPADHFELMLEHFCSLCRSHRLRKVEYLENLEQARLVDQVSRSRVS